MKWALMLSVCASLFTANIVSANPVGHDGKDGGNVAYDVFNSLPSTDCKDSKGCDKKPCDPPRGTSAPLPGAASSGAALLLGLGVFAVAKSKKKTLA